MVRFRSIDYIRLKIKTLAQIVDRRDAYAALIVVFTGISAFMLGKLSAIDANTPPVTIERWGGDPVALSGIGEGKSDALQKPPISVETENAALLIQAEKYVASKSGSKYYLPDCSGAKRIGESNKIWFSSREEAQRAGYSPASGCKGL